MFDRHAKTIETFANVGIVIVAMLGAAVLAKQLMGRNGVPAATAAPAPVISRAPAVGTRISLPGVSWSDREHTLVFVLSTTCRFCTNSAPFYHRLVRESQRTGKVRLIAVLPQTTSDATTYLQQLGVGIDHVIQAPLATLATRGTPTLILVDRSGIVKRTWTGQLPPPRESEVLAHF